MSSESELYHGKPPVSSLYHGMPLNRQVTSPSVSSLYRKYKSSFSAALTDLFVHSVHLVCAVYAVWLFRASVVASTISVPFLGLMLHRNFVVFHDCGHNSYFPDANWNRALATVLGITTFTSTNWMLDHGVHHLTNGNIDNKYRFKFNELLYYTAAQYRRFSPVQKWTFAFFHTPAVFFTVFPVLYFGVIQRFIYWRKKAMYGDKIAASLKDVIASHVVNNAGTIGILYAAAKTGILWHVLAASYLGFLVDFLLFFNQHTYNPCYVVNDDEWKQRDSGLRGSSFIQIPERLKYFTMGIEYHHIHHMNSKIPGYNLRKYHEEMELHNPEMFSDVVQLTMEDCYRNLWLVLYDEKKRKYVTRREAEEDSVIVK